jgi:predicted GH43/DUF377 family glycosyl hydrolase
VNVKPLLIGLVLGLTVLVPGVAAGATLPGWAIGPFTRYEGNPILKPRGTGWESLQTFNPGVVRVDGSYKMLYRATRPVQISSIGLATSADGLHFERHGEEPVIGPGATPSESLAVEDPRLFYLDGTYYTFYTGFSGQTNLNEATSTDLIHWERLGTVVPGTKNGAVVTDPAGRPVKIRGQYQMYAGQFEDFSIWTSPDMKTWTKQGAVDLGYGIGGIPDEVCVAVTNYPRRDGTISEDIVLFTAGRLDPLATWFYAISEQLYSRDDLAKRLDDVGAPVFVPTATYELLGLTPNTVFMNSILFNGKQWMMHYGAADTVMGVATAPGPPGGTTASGTDQDSAAPKLRFTRRVRRGRRLELRLLGAKKDAVREVRFYINSRRVAVDRRFPFRRTVRVASRRSVLALKAVVVVPNGRKTTLRRTLRRG